MHLPRSASCTPATIRQAALALALLALGLPPVAARAGRAALPSPARVSRAAPPTRAGLSATPSRPGEDDSLEGRYFHRHWRRADGLPGNSVYAIAQSADGYIWVGTENGVARFDGQRFFAYGASQPEIFHSRWVAALLAAADDTLWIGTERGLLRMRDGALAREGAPGSPADEASISALAQDPAGDLWIGTRSGLLRRDARSGAISAVGLAGVRVTQLLAGEAGEVWIGTEMRGPWRVRAGRLASVPGDPGLGQESVRALLHGPDGSVLVFTSSGGRRFEDGRFIAGPPAGAAPLDPLAQPHVAAARAVGDGLLLATSDRGLVEIGASGRWLPRPEHPLANAVVFSILVSADRTIWFGAAGDGLHQLVKKSCRTYTRRDGLPSDAATAVLAEPDGSLWVGTLSGLARMERRGGDGFSVRTELPGATVYALLRDWRGTLWAGTERGVARRLSGRPAAPWEFLPAWGGPATHIVASLYEDRRHDIWIATAGGLGVMTASSARVTPVRGLAGREVTDLAEANDGALWIGTRGSGLFRLHEGRLERLRSVEEVPVVTSLRRGPGREMWVGTYGTGLLQYRDGIWSRFDEASGLADNYVRQLTDDSRGALWICTGAGIARLPLRLLLAAPPGSAAALHPFGYGPEDGVAEGVCYGFSHPGTALGPDHHLWFTTNRGLVEIRPERLAPPPSPPAIHLDGVTVDGLELEHGRWRHPALQGSLRRLDLRFSAPIFIAQRHTALRYRLVGFDRDWIADGGERTAHYTSLPGGRYRFEVAFRDQRGRWGQPVRLSEIEVTPHLYQRSELLALAALALLGLAFQGHRLAERRLVRHAAELEEMVAVRTGELQELTVALRAANRKLETLATSDSLTGLAHRRRLQEARAAEMRRAERSRSELSLILLDVDYFKGYNDTLGHLAGDDCLREVGMALRSAAQRTSDLVSRYGGEEFAVLLPETSAAQAWAVAERVRQLIEKLALPNPSSKVAGCVTISAGVASVVPDLGCEPAQLIAEADRALYRAKQSGRNRVVAAEPAAAGARHAPMLTPAA